MSACERAGPSGGIAVVDSARGEPQAPSPTGAIEAAAPAAASRAMARRRVSMRALWFAETSRTLLADTEVMQKPLLLVVALLLAGIAVGLELLRHLVSPAHGDVRELVLGIEMFVWLFAGVALLRRHFVSA